MTTDDASALEAEFAHWRGYLRRRRAIDGPDVDELEDHLRDQVGALRAAGRAGAAAVRVAVQRMGRLDAMSREFAQEHSERLWKQFVVPPEPDARAGRSIGVEALVVLGLAVAAALTVKVPELFGRQLVHGDEAFYARNAGFFAFPFLAAYFAWKRGITVAMAARLSVAFVVAAVVANAFPGRHDQDLLVLTALHLPIALWWAVGIAYVGGPWSGDRRMDFVRFSGELAIYYVLIALGGVALTGVTMMLFRAIGVDAAWFAFGWLVPCGAAGAVLVASWLVEAKQGVIENMAPVLTRLFTPLFTAVLLAFLGAMAWTGHPIDVQREVLIAFDLLLALVVGLVLYATSARDPRSPPGPFDALQLVLVGSALAVDAVALAAIAARIHEFGFTPNKVAALGENLILLVSLAGTAWAEARFLRGRGTFVAFER